MTASQISSSTAVLPRLLLPRRLFCAGLIAAAAACKAPGDADAWAREHRDEAASYLSQLLGIDQEAMRLSVGRTAWGIGPITDETIERQQRIADTFLRIGLLQRPIRIRDAVAPALL